jgi:hypothetical protein
MHLAEQDQHQDQHQDQYQEQHQHQSQFAAEELKYVSQEFFVGPGRLDLADQSTYVHTYMSPTDEPTLYWCVKYSLLLILCSIIAITDLVFTFALTYTSDDLTHITIILLQVHGGDVDRRSAHSQQAARTQ